MEGLGKVLVINGCSQSKLPHPAPAREFYTGQLFRMVRKFSELHGFTQKIVSGKYGLLSMVDLVDPYDMKITTKADVNRVQEKCLYSLVSLHRTYDTIIVRLGGKYREVISPIIDSKCLVIFEKKGLFAYYSLFAKLNKMSRDQALEELSRFRVSECKHCEIEDNLPHTCYFCSYRDSDKCSLDIDFQPLTPIQQKTTSEGQL